MRLAVVIPTLNEATTIVAAIRDLKGQGPDEVIVTDGGSRDGTAELARAEGVGVVEGPPGRGVQQNRGAAAVQGDLLLFLHADCQLEPGAIASLRTFMATHRRVPGGCFRMRVASGNPLFRWIERGGHLRAGALGIPYGDQGIFVRRQVFDALGGFPEIPILEDVMFSIRLAQRGRLALLPHRILVSPRRWHQTGIVAQTIRNWTLTAGAALGMTPSRLAQFYPEVR